MGTLGRRGAGTDEFGGGKRRGDLKMHWGGNSKTHRMVGF